MDLTPEQVKALRIAEVKTKIAWLLGAVEGLAMAQPKTIQEHSIGRAQDIVQQAYDALDQLMENES